MYRYAGAALVRAAAHAAGSQPSWPRIRGDAEADADQWRCWAARTWATPSVAEAIETATPGLAAMVGAILAGSQVGAGRERRAVLSLARYTLRMEHRATPFGLFAGVAAAEIGPGLKVSLGAGHRPVARADAAWIADVTATLEGFPDLLRRLEVTADPACAVRGDRLVLPCRQPDPRHANTAPAEVSVRHTPAVRMVMTAAAVPVTVASLAGQLASAYPYPRTPARVIDDLLAELVARRFLLSSLRSPTTDCDALDHLNEQLSAVGADDIAQAAPIVCALRQIRELLDRHNRAAPAERRGLRISARDRMRAVSDVAEQPVAVDLALDCQLVLPVVVVGEAERAAATLARLAPFPAGPPAWLDYHARFLERYGAGALVPVLDLTDSRTGLGFPAGYRGSPLSPPARALTPGDERLLALAQDAAIDGTGEIVLSDQLLADLAPAGDRQVPPHLDIRIQLRAPSARAIADGDFTIAVTGFFASGGASAGRFLYLLPGTARDRLSRTFAALPPSGSGALRAQVCGPPLDARTGNVSRAPAILPAVIAVGEPAGGTAIPLADLAVTADARRLRLVSIPTGRVVEPCALNAVEAGNFTQPLARFLREIPLAHAATLGLFGWGAARRLPYLPRVRYGRAILAPATWRVSAASLAGPAASWREWTASLEACRERLRLPAAVYAGAGDQRLRLELDEPAHLALLRDQLDRRGRAVLSEAPGPADFGWFGHHAHEIVLTLASASAPAPGREAHRPSSVTIRGREHGHLPGVSRWACARLFAPREEHARLLTTYIPALLKAWDKPPRYWFTRLADPQDHLVLRFPLSSPAAFADTTARVGIWAADLRNQGLASRLLWDTYYPETGRYGAGQLMEAAEAVFAADSAAAITQLAFAASGGHDHRAVTAASIADLAVSFHGGTAAGARWLIAHPPAGTVLPTERELYRRAIRLADPAGRHAELRRLPGGEAVTAAWAARRAAIAAYARLLEIQDGPDLDLVFRSFLHMHHVRVAGTGEACEKVCYRLARSGALSWSARQKEPAQ